MSSSSQHVSPWPHRFAVVLTCATFPLIWVGGLVTTYDAGMAVEDWPNTYGYNLFLYPWKTWIFGPFDLFIEHGHRLLGALAGFLTIALLVSLLLAERRTWMKWVGFTALLAVIGQGLLGGMRVLFDDRQLAMIHGCVGPAFFAFTVAICVFTSRFWHSEGQGEGGRDPVAGRSLAQLALLTLGFSYIQLALGASLRHLPIDATVAYFRGAVVFHLLMAAVVTFHAAALTNLVWKAGIGWGLRGPVAVLMGAVILQLILGGGSWVVKYGWPEWIADTNLTAGYTIQTNSLSQALTVTAHVANGSLILAMATMVAVRACRAFPLLAEESGRVGDRNSGQRRIEHCGVGHRRLLSEPATELRDSASKLIAKPVT